MKKSFNILVAPDSFKDCLSAFQICEAFAKGVRSYNQDISLDLCPISDGGEGILDILNKHLDIKKIWGEVFNPIGKKIKAFFLWNQADKTAYISVAQASGLELLASADRNPMNTSSFGTGQLVAEAVKLGATKVILFLGGSATNDAGLGLAQALGFSFYNSKGLITQHLRGKDLQHIQKIGVNHQQSFDSIEFLIASDVLNPFIGKEGATYVYAAQKAAKPIGLEVLEAGMTHIWKLFLDTLNIDINIPGTGAAGGIGGGIFGLMNGTIISGFDTLSEIIDFENRMEAADIIVTGEGRLDEQSFNGKVVGEIISKAKKKRKNGIIICGQTIFTVDHPEIQPFKLFVQNSGQEIVTNSNATYTYIEELGKNLALNLEHGSY